MNSPCSTTPGIIDRTLAQPLGLIDGAERAVKNIVSPVGDERRGPAAQADRAGEAEAGEGAFDMAARRREAEGNDLDRQRKGAEHANQLGRIGDHRHPLRGRGDDLLAQQRAAAALDQSQLRIDFVRSVDRQIELRKLVQRRERNAEAPCLLLGRLGRRRRRRTQDRP